MLRDFHEEIKLGIIGTGRIAERFVPEAAFVPDVKVTGVYNPHLESAKRFVSDKGIPNCTDALEPFLKEVDAVYIASPHATHYEYIKAALNAGKHVLCEKPMVLKRSEAEELFLSSREKGLVLMEAVKTAYCPGFKLLAELPDKRKDVIGDIKNVEACFTKIESPDSRELTDMLTGGSFTELGSYCMLPVLYFLGTDYRDIKFDSIKAENGLDIFTRAAFVYDKAIATITCGLGVKSEGKLLICGTKGFIEVSAPWWKTSKIKVYDENGSLSDEYSIPFEGDGLRYEISGFAGRIRGKETAETEDISVAMAGIFEEFLIKGRTTTG